MPLQCLQVKETGHLETVDQQEPWLMGKKKDGGLPFNYLKREIKVRCCVDESFNMGELEIGRREKERFQGRLGGMRIKRHHIV